jgi:hypothetical protein
MMRSDFNWKIHHVTPDSVPVQVQLLWRVVRKMNENADSIESLANGAEKRVESLSSEVKKVLCN